MNKNTLLNQNYICPIGVDVRQMGNIMHPVPVAIMLSVTPTKARRRDTRSKDD